jgi:hypothetical protein
MTDGRGCAPVRRGGQGYERSQQTSSRPEPACGDVRPAEFNRALASMQIGGETGRYVCVVILDPPRRSGPGRFTESAPAVQSVTAPSPPNNWTISVIAVGTAAWAGYVKVLTTLIVRAALPVKRYWKLRIHTIGIPGSASTQLWVSRRRCSCVPAHRTELRLTARCVRHHRLRAHRLRQGHPHYRRCAGCTSAPPARRA